MLSHILVLAFSLIILLALFVCTGEVYTLGLFILLLVILVCDIVISRVLFKKLTAEISMKSSSVTGKNVQLILTITGKKLVPFVNGFVKLRLHNITFDTNEIITKSFTIQDEDELPELSNIVIDLDSSYCGKYDVSIDYVRLYDILGMSYKNIIKKMKKSVYIYPTTAPLDSVSDAQRINYEKERYFSHQKNTNLSEILQYREYQPGGNLRHTNWKLSDRFDEMLVREFDTPTDNQVLVTYDIEPGNKFTMTLVYSALMSISSSYITKNIFHQIGWFRTSDKRSVYRNMYRMEDLYEAMRMIFDDAVVDASHGKTAGKMNASRSASIMSLLKSDGIKKYAKVIYVTNHIDKKIQKEIRLYENIQLILLDESVVEGANAGAGAKTATSSSVGSNAQNVAGSGSGAKTATGASAGANAQTTTGFSSGAQSTTGSQTGSSAVEQPVFSSTSSAANITSHTDMSEEIKKVLRRVAV